MGSDGQETLEHEQSGACASVAARFGGVVVRLVNADDPAAPSARWRLDGQSEVAIARAAAGGPPTRAGYVELDDRYASSRHVLLTRGESGWFARDEGSRNGTFVDGRPLEPGERRLLGEEALLEVGHTFLLFRAEARGAAGAPALVSPARDGDREPPTLNPEWELELESVDRLAPTLHPVLVEGESGVGKEVLARRLHQRSGRPGPLVAVNCAALAESLLDDELFGHVRGAFSGAQGERPGLVRAAHQGTLFLDEVGEMPPSLQAKLLRVLEDHRVRPIGTEAEISVDVRVIAATNRDLRRLVAEGAFRADVLARLGLVSVRVPPLRRRREDLGILLRAVLRSVPRGLERVRFELQALRRMLLHPWPLNVRELRHALLVAVDLAREGDAAPIVVGPHHLPEAVRGSHLPSMPKAPEEPRSPSPGRAAPPLGPEEARQRAELVALLERHDGNVASAARELGRPRTTLQRLLARLGIERCPASKVTPGEP